MFDERKAARAAPRPAQDSTPTTRSEPLSPIDSNASENRYGWLLALGAASLLVAGAFAPALVGGAAGEWVRQVFAPVCHQLPERSFTIAGQTLAVCHRCLGIYAGLLGGVAAWPLLAARLRRLIGRRTGAIVLAAGAPAALDWALGVAGLWQNTAWTQTATGALLGTALGLALARAATQAALSAAPARRSTPTGA